MKKNRGITLVALVITIIILIILAGISISILLGEGGLINKAQQGAENYQKAEEAERSILDAINEKIDSITTGGTGSTGGTPTTNIAYTIGQEVTVGGEQFFVIEDSNSSTSTVKLLAAQNVITTEGNANRYKQDASANTLAFDDDSNDYATSEIKTHVDAYKAAVEGRMGSGKTIEEARLMTKEEVDALGGDSTHYNTSGCTGTTAFVNATNYWLGSPCVSDSRFVWLVRGGSAGFDFNSYFTDDSTYGLRPVLVVLKSNI